jgi:glycosyltransferase involved in cell wall biosynthesis
MKISLIITTYNRVNLLKNLLISIKGQHFTPYELIISDDGSSEDIVAEVQDLIQDFEFGIKFVKQVDLGFRLARCRNNAVRVSEGDFLIFVDQDLMFSNGFLSKFQESISEGNVIVGYPIRLTQEQTKKISDENILKGDFSRIITKRQRNKIISQYRKDKFNRFLQSIKIQKKGTKFRGGITGMFKKDYLKINGYDENFIGWGNEDDDFGRRLLASGVRPINPFKNVYPLHHWHKEFHNNGERVNKDYNKKRKSEINQNNFIAKFGISNTLGEDKIDVIRLK